MSGTIERMGRDNNEKWNNGTARKAKDGGMRARSCSSRLKGCQVVGLTESVEEKAK